MFRIEQESRVRCAVSWCCDRAGGDDLAVVWHVTRAKNTSKRAHPAQMGRAGFAEASLHATAGTALDG